MKGFAAVLGPTIFAVVLAIEPPRDLEVEAWRVLGAAAWMAIWWIGEVIPLAATALLPIVVFPMLGTGGIVAATAPYASPVIFLFLGGFLMGRAVQRWDLHRRIAIVALSRTGDRPDRVIATIMAITAFLSMWISNTATAVMMLPIALSLISVAEHRSRASGQAAPIDAFATALLLGVAYAASIGGIATLIGTPPNAVFAGYVAKTHGISISFAGWLVVGLPLSLVLLPATWFVLTRILFRAAGTVRIATDATIGEGLRELGPVSPPEKRVAAVFAAVAALWMLRPVVEALAPVLLPHDAAIAIAGAVLMFVVPAGGGRPGPLLDWDHARRIPWEVLVLFGGGLSLAAAITDSGLARWAGEILSVLGSVPPAIVLIGAVSTVIFVTELTSNTATTATFLPIATALAASLSRDPMWLLVPMTLAASCAFMMPIATPPNAIVFGSGRLTVPVMVRAGIWLNILAIVLISASATTLVALAFGRPPGA